MKFEFENDTFGCHDPLFTKLEHGMARFNVHFKDVRRAVVIGIGSGPQGDFAYVELDLEQQAQGTLRSARVRLIAESKEEEDLILNENVTLYHSLKRELEVFFLPKRLLYSDIYERLDQKA